jgi:hypothetical protein
MGLPFLMASIAVGALGAKYQGITLLLQTSEYQGL